MAEGSAKAKPLKTLQRFLKGRKSQRPGKCGSCSSENDIETDSIPEKSNVDGSLSPELLGFSCEKQKTHTFYHPVDSLSETDLPLPYKDNKMWRDFISLKSCETVKLTVSCTSNDRPDDLGFENLRGTSTKRQGSGTVFITGMQDVETCNCNHVEGDHEVSGPFQIMTAAHLIYDNEEAKRTVIEFFDDSEDSKSKSGIVKAWCERVVSVDVKGNRSIVECRTHDLSLFEKLQNYRKEKDQLEQKLKAADQEQIKEGDMVFVISHPHGLSKHVSFGCLIEKEKKGPVREVSDELRLADCILTYTAPTCPGSGGGSVNWVKGGQIMGFAPHCASRGKNENVSGLGWMRAT